MDIPNFSENAGEPDSAKQDATVSGNAGEDTTHKMEWCNHGIVIE